MIEKKEPQEQNNDYGIFETDNPILKNWKYYNLNNSFNKYKYQTEIEENENVQIA